MWICLLLTSQILLIRLLLLNLVSPVIHPLHPVQVGLGNETSFNLNPLELFIVSLLLKLLCSFFLLFVDLFLFLFLFPDLLDIFH